MSGSFNKVMLMGNLTRDVETRTAGNTTVGNFGIALNRKYKTKDGEQREETTFVDCTAWGRTAEVMAQYIGKGDPVFIEGRLKLDEWEDKNSGQKRSKIEVVVESFQFVGGASGNQGQSRPSGHEPGGTTIDTNDIPF